jgi:MFS family permease
VLDPRSGSEGDADGGVVGGRRALATVVGIVFLDLLGFGIVIPILPFYVRSFGASDVVYGLLAASYSLMQFVAAPYLGRLSDERGRRPVLMLSLLANAVAWTVFGLAGELETAIGTTAAIATLFAARMLAGAMGGNIAAAQAYIADVTPPERRAGALGLIGAAFGLGFVFGPAFGSVLASDPVVGAAGRVLPDVIPATRFSLPSFGAAAFSIVAFLAAAAFLKEPDRTRSSAAKVGLVGQFRTALASATLRPLVIASLVASIAFSGVQVIFIPFVADIYGFDASGAGLLLTYIGALGVVNQGVVVGRLSRRYRDLSLAVAGAVLLVAALALLPFSPAVGALLLGDLTLAGVDAATIALLGVLALLSTGNGLLNVALSTLVSRSASEDEQGAAFGVTQGAGSLGRTVGPPFMAALYVTAYWSPFALGAVLTVGIVALLLGMRRVERGGPDPESTTG